MCTKKMLERSSWSFAWSLSTALLAAAASHGDPAASSLLDDGVFASSSGRLAVVVPTQQGDLSRAVESLRRWPSTCSPVTQRSVDLVVYYAQMADEADSTATVTQATQRIAETAGLCFSMTRVVYAHLDGKEDTYYPNGLSVQFYDMFLDEDVRPHLAEYDALALIEWDVLVADDKSFEELYKAAFSTGDDFWVKGSRVGGTGFHRTSEVQDMWNVLGYINGNAIYNNNDPEFVEYVKYTLTRWHYDHPYDVALWLTISDFPYSWPIWQRYSGKFVSTNLISYLGTEHVDTSIVSDAVAGHTLFIQDNKAEDKKIASIKTASEQTSKGLPQAFASHQPLRETVVPESLEPSCLRACGDRGTQGLPLGTSTVCDKTCVIGARYGGFLCGAGNLEKFGSMCRLCYTDVNEALRVERDLQAGSIDGSETNKHVVMCETMQPPELEDCTDECARSEEAVCDSSCGNGRYGGYNCNWRNRGRHCRFCFDDYGAALMADEVAKRHGGRVIMCSTLEPPQAAPVASLRGYTERSLKLQDRRLSTTSSDTQDATSSDTLWDTIDCLEGCEYTSFDGTRGRVCDATCQTGEPYGTYGCPARDGRYGEDCRVCYNDIDKATNQMDKGNVVIMCDTLAPPNVYRRLRVVGKYESASSVARRLQSLKNTVMSKNGKEKGRTPDNRGDASSRSFSSDPEYDTLSPPGVYPDLHQDDKDSAVRMSRSYREQREGVVHPHLFSPAPEVATRTAGDGKDATWHLTKSASRPFFGDLAWSNLCVFLAGRAGDLDRLEATVASILQFVPGMRVAVAAAENSLDEYESALGRYPDVKITGASNPYAEGLFADKHCGAGTEFIFYIEPGSIVSRSFTSKDTHSPRGDLLVAYSDARSSHRHTKLTRDTAALLGFKAPSFTFETDLFLPFRANADLRKALSNYPDNNLADADEDEAALQAVKTLELMDYFTIPQLLAAVQYSLNRGGLWFINPQEWLEKNMFKSASIWDIPLLKPRFTCSLPPTVDPDSIDVAEVLHSRMEFFSRGGTCENGFISLEETR